MGKREAWDRSEYEYIEYVDMDVISQCCIDILSFYNSRQPMSVCNVLVVVEGMYNCDSIPVEQCGSEL